MSITSTVDHEPGLLAAARAGDQAAFAALMGPHGRALHVHCYRMLGSLDDADDALQGAPHRELGWPHRHRDDWLASGRPWPDYLRGWAETEHLHTAQDILAKLGTRSTPNSSPGGSTSSPKSTRSARPDYCRFAGRLFGDANHWRPPRQCATAQKVEL